MMKEMIRKVMEWCKLWNGETATAKQAGPSSDKREKEQAADNREVQDRLENYLWKHYEFRFNVLTEQPEYCAKGQGTDTPYKIVTQRTLNTLCLEAHRHRINCWDKDVSRLLHSERLEDYHPFLTYMDTLPQWDGVDRVTPLAQRISKKAFGRRCLFALRPNERNLSGFPRLCRLWISPRRWPAAFLLQPTVRVVRCATRNSSPKAKRYPSCLRRALREPGSSSANREAKENFL